MTDEEERYADALEIIRQWCRAYPVEMFTPLSDDEVKLAAKVLEDNSISCGALHAQWARHILSGIEGIVDEALK